jgi:predicted metal-dependent HD superfamily phosphohydrolase
MLTHRHLPRGAAALLAALPLPRAIQALLCRHLAQPGRCYHGFGHLTLLWQRHRRFGRGGPGATPRATRRIAAAILFHDVILRPGAMDNEARSAALWRRQARRLRGFSPADIAWVAATIEASAQPLRVPAGRTAEARLQRWFLDLDLAPLGETAPRFRANGRALRAEAQRLGRFAYAAAERRFLSAMDAAPAILCHPRLRAAFEAQARANIRAALRGQAQGGPQAPGTMAEIAPPGWRRTPRQGRQQRDGSPRPLGPPPRDHAHRAWP